MKIIIFLTLFSLSLALDYDDEPKMGQSCKCGWKNEKVVDANRFPWMAVIFDRDHMKHIGGGALITQWHVVTAQSNVKAHKPAELVVCLGVIDETFCDKENKPDLYSVKKIYNNKHYNKNSHRNDISVILLWSEIVVSRTLGPACFPTMHYTDYFMDESLKLMGYGSGGINPLKELDLNVVPLQKCVRRHELLDVYGYSQMCTYSTIGSTRNGDLGDPVVWLDPQMDRYTLVGLLSHGPERIQNARNPDVSTNVSYFSDWIKSRVKSNNNIKQNI